MSARGESAGNPPGFDNDRSASWIGFRRSISGIVARARSYSRSAASRIVSVRVLPLSLAGRRTAISVAGS
jgi:hypothetical protein